MSFSFEDETRYRDTVNSALAFSGRDVDFFARLKADDLVARLDRHLGSAARARVLDVGCGPGITDAHLVGRVGELHGVDVAGNLLDEAAAANPGASYHAFDGASLPFEDGAFDASFAICVLHHVDPGERPALLGEMRRITRPGGIVAVYEHTPWNPLTRVVVATCEFDVGVQLLRPAETRRLLRGAGFVPLESRYTAFFPWGGSLFRRVERALSRVPIGAQYVVVGQAARER